MHTKSIFLFMALVALLSQAFAVGMTSGSYPGEFYTNNIWYYDAQFTGYYCFGYSPDSGKHFIVTLTVQNPFIQENIHGVDTMGEFYLHDSNFGYLYKFQNFGASLNWVNVDFDGIDGIEPGAGMSQLYLFDNADGGCFLHKSENGGMDYSLLNYFPLLEIKHMACVRETGMLYLLAYDQGEGELILLRSGDNGQSFASFVLDGQLQTPEAEHLLFKLLPKPDGTIFLFQHWMSGAEREYRLYESLNDLQSCALVWQYVPLMYEYVDLLWSGAEQAELLKESFYWYMAFNTLQYSVSSDVAFEFQPTGFYSFQQPYQNPPFLVPTASEPLLAPEAGSVKLYVRSNADWQISCDAGWVSGFSQTSGNASADVLMNYQANMSQDGRSCHVHFMSAAAPDTFLVITQSGFVPAEDSELAHHVPATAFPNPFYHSTSIKGNLSPGGQVEVKFYNIRGELVETLGAVCDAGGDFSLEWLPTDGKGNRIAAGVYLCRLSDGNRSLALRLLHQR
jgi:hypothetical protein